MTRSCWRASAALAVAGLLAGCGSTANIVSGGAVPGSTRTVYSILPHPGEGTSRDFVLGEKLAIEEAGGRAGGYGLSFVSLDDSAPGPKAASARAGVVAEQAIHDPQVIAIIGGTDSEQAKVTIPLIDAAGILHLLPGAGYPGFTRAIGPDEPARWLPAGDDGSVVRLVPDDIEQGRALLDAAVRAAGGVRGVRVAIEEEPRGAMLADGARAAARARGVRIVDSVEEADAVIYAGEDPVNAVGVARSVRKPMVFGDALVRAGIAGRLPRAALRRAVLVSGAPAPGSAAVRALQPRFTAAFGRPPGPYSVLGYRAMKAVIAAVGRAAPHDRRRQAVTKAFRPPPSGFTAYRASGEPL